MFQIANSTFGDIKKMTKAIAMATAAFPSLWEKALNDSGDIALKYFGRQFKSEGAEMTAKWKPLSPGTIKSRKRKGYKPGPVLVRRGWLRASMTSKTSASAQRKVSKTGITMWSTLKTKGGGHNLAEIHHRGTRTIPARPIYRESSPPFISQKGWDEIGVRLTGMFLELRRMMETK